MSRRELSWKWRLPVAIAAITAMILISRSMVRGTELQIPRMHRGIVIDLTMHREKGPGPKYVAPATPIDRPAGTP
jgi:hypothetical protein